MGINCYNIQRLFSQGLKEFTILFDGQEWLKGVGVINLAPIIGVFCL